MAETGTMAAILTALTSIVTSIISMMGQIVTFITSNDLVLMFTLVGFCGIGVGLLRRVLGL